jgi:CRISPR-associated protein Cas2
MINVVIAYDIVSDRRRNKLVKVLKDYGHRINYSVFECEIKRKSLLELKEEISGIINIKKDSVLYYELCQGCVGKKDTVGIKKSDKFERIVYV